MVGRWIDAGCCSERDGWGGSLRKGLVSNKLILSIY